MQALNPKTENLKPLRPFLDLAPLRILGLLLDVKAEVHIAIIYVLSVISVLNCVGYEC